MFAAMKNLMVVVAVGSLLLVACGGKKPVGETCSESSECDAKTQCVLGGSTKIVSGMLTCVDTYKVCSVTCTTSADCTSALGNGYICKSDCFKGSCFQGSER